MLLKQLFNQVTMATVLAGATCAVTAPVFAQGFLYPSASFFSPFAAYYQSADEEVDLALLLEQYPAFNSRLQEANLLETLENQNYLTILVPSEEAFAALSPEMKQKLTEPENMKKLMQYHMVMGQISESDFQHGSVATVLEKNSVQITSVPVGDNKIRVKLNEATASEPLAATDGVVIPLDQVLIPPEFLTETK
ncbi:MAG: fasciclin domain-containing protein [Pleurocapsa sp. MO_192.B19]|nr:fasciclin domain-containing protein [Pleurocapsa sp. MO_192.B19]